MNQEIVSTSGLAVGYGKQVIIDGIEISVNAGEILTMIGPNGSGKTTMLRTMTQSLTPIAGCVYLNQKNLSEISGKQLARQTAIVFTNKIHTEYMTCEEVVETGRYPYTGGFGRLREEDRRKVNEVMKLFHLEELAQQDFTKISDGQRQRVMIARAVCQEPNVILLDEPTTFLDIHYKLELLKYLRMLAKQEQVAIILSLHELELVRKVADQVLCVKDGKVFLYGNTDEIMTKEHMEELYDLPKGELDLWQNVL